MNEFLGLAYFAEIPAVLFDIQRAGPSTGMPTRTQQGDILSAALASHGDTKHPLLIPSTPKECFDFAADAFDYADQLQTPIIVMSDLDLGMNEITSEAFAWDDTREYNHGKVLTADDLDRLDKFGRYLDVDGDGIGYRTLPGTHPSKGAFFTRGTSRDEYAVYTEDPDVYTENMQRLLTKWETAREMLPKAEIEDTDQSTGVIYYGTSAIPMKETLMLLSDAGVVVDTMRIRSFPFGPEVEEFISSHQPVFLIEQNRDAQMKTLLVNDLGLNPDEIESVLYFGGMSISADFIFSSIVDYYDQMNIPRLQEVAS